ncbi:hypothetical protein K1719_012068 [Acacia pycnantha]|nr:hypothetical protein K1719_012068 [Acacia pycnantha]
MVRTSPSIGLSGGLAIAWDSSRITVDIVEEDRQFLHLCCHSAHLKDYLITVVYAIPHSDLRSVLWNKLLRLSQASSLPWALIGNFNDTMTVDERIGGRGGNLRRMQWFCDRISECRVSDLGAIGPKMTWKGPRLASCTRLYERLDRVFTNNLFIDTVPDSYAKGESKVEQPGLDGIDQIHQL